MMLLRTSAIRLLILVVFTLLPFTVLANDHKTVPLSAEELKGITPFAAVVQRNWNSWSKGNATVTKLDLIAQMASPAYTGEDAAALVALEIYLKKNPAVDLATAAAIDDPKILDRYYRNVLKLRRVKRVLFANGQPTFELLQQGPVGDCYFFSASGWMARNRPGDVMNAITRLDDGRFRVRFANGDEATVTAPTPMQNWQSMIQIPPCRMESGCPYWKRPPVPFRPGPIGSQPRYRTPHRGYRHGRHTDRQCGKTLDRARGERYSALVRGCSGIRCAGRLSGCRSARHWQPRFCCIAPRQSWPMIMSMPLWALIRGRIRSSGIRGERISLPTAHPVQKTAMPAKKGIFTLNFDEFVSFYSYLAIEQN